MQNCDGEARRNPLRQLMGGRHIHVGSELILSPRCGLKIRRGLCAKLRQGVPQRASRAVCRPSPTSSREGPRWRPPWTCGGSAWDSAFRREGVPSASRMAPLTAARCNRCRGCKLMAAATRRGGSYHIHTPGGPRGSRAPQKQDAPSKTQPFARSDRNARSQRSAQKDQDARRRVSIRGVTLG